MHYVKSIHNCAFFASENSKCSNDVGSIVESEKNQHYGDKQCQKCTVCVMHDKYNKPVSQSNRPYSG